MRACTITNAFAGLNALDQRRWYLIGSFTGALTGLDRLLTGPSPIACGDRSQESEDGENTNFKYGMCAMQGWRTEMVRSSGGPLIWVEKMMLVDNITCTRGHV